MHTHPEFLLGMESEYSHSLFHFASFFCLYNSSKVQDMLAADLSDGKLKISIDKEFAFSKEGAVEMMKYIESGKGRGKNVMNM